MKAILYISVLIISWNSLAQNRNYSKEDLAELAERVRKKEEQYRRNKQAADLLKKEDKYDRNITSVEEALEQDKKALRKQKERNESKLQSFRLEPQVHEASKDTEPSPRLQKNQDEQGLEILVKERAAKTQEEYKKFQLWRPKN